MNEEKTVEHHWHKPTQGQVIKAMYQFLADQGITQATINEVIEKKVASILAGKVDAWVNSGRFNELLTNAVAYYVQTEKKMFTGNGDYSLRNRLRDLIQQELQRLLTSNYEVEVVEKPRPE